MAHICYLLYVACFSWYLARNYKKDSRPSLMSKCCQASEASQLAFHTVTSML